MNMKSTFDTEIHRCNLWHTGRVTAGMFSNLAKKASNGSHHMVMDESSETKRSALGRLNRRDIV